MGYFATNFSRAFPVPLDIVRCGGNEEEGWWGEFALEMMIEGRNAMEAGRDVEMLGRWNECLTMGYRSEEDLIEIGSSVMNQMYSVEQSGKYGISMCWGGRDI
jgi:hypothetical protein